MNNTMQCCQSESTPAFVSQSEFDPAFAINRVLLLHEINHYCYYKTCGIWQDDVLCKLSQPIHATLWVNVTWSYNRTNVS